MNVSPSTHPAADHFAVSVTDDLRAHSRALEALEAQEVLRLALATFGASARISTAFGATGLVLMDLAQQIDPQVSAYSIDTGFNFPETEALIERWRARGLNLEVMRPQQTPAEQAAVHGEALWTRDPDRCCALRKVEPNDRALAGAKLWIAALRRDESASRQDTPLLSAVTLPSGQRILKLCPLAAWTKAQVWRYILDHQLPYNPLSDLGYASIGCTHCTRPVAAGEDERAGRWAGTAKRECGLHLAPGPLK